jgi:hypothetical protein
MLATMCYAYIRPLPTHAIMQTLIDCRAAFGEQPIIRQRVQRATGRTPMWPRVVGRAKECLTSAQVRPSLPPLGSAPAHLLVVPC